MSYIGKSPADSFISFAKQDFSTSATTSYTLDNAVTNENELALFINFVRQEPTTAYTASGTTLTLTSATTSSDDMYCVYLGQAKQTVNAPDGSVGSSQVAASIITGQTALGATPADTDELLISDAGTLKRVDYSYLKSANTPNFFATKSDGNQTVNDGTNNLITFNNELIDSDSAYASNTFTVPSGKAGVYQVSTSVNFYDSNGNLKRSIVYIYKNDQDELAHTMDFGSNNMYNITNTFSGLLNLSVGDTLKVYGFFDSSDDGSGVVVSAGSAYETWFQAFKLI